MGAQTWYSSKERRTTHTARRAQCVAPDASKHLSLHPFHNLPQQHSHQTSMPSIKAIIKNFFSALSCRTGDDENEAPPRALVIVRSRYVVVLRDSLSDMHNLGRSQRLQSQRDQGRSSPSPAHRWHPASLCARALSLVSLSRRLQDPVLMCIQAHHILDWTQRFWTARSFCRSINRKLFFSGA